MCPTSISHPIKTAAELIHQFGLTQERLDQAFGAEQLWRGEARMRLSELSGVQASGKGKQIQRPALASAAGGLFEKRDDLVKGLSNLFFTDGSAFVRPFQTDFSLIQFGNLKDSTKQYIELVLTMQELYDQANSQAVGNPLITSILELDQLMLKLGIKLLQRFEEREQAQENSLLAAQESPSVTEAVVQPVALPTATNQISHAQAALRFFPRDSRSYTADTVQTSKTVTLDHLRALLDSESNLRSTTVAATLGQLVLSGSSLSNASSFSGSDSSDSSGLVQLSMEDMELLLTSYGRLQLQRGWDLKRHQLKTEESFEALHEVIGS